MSLSVAVFESDPRRDSQRVTVAALLALLVHLVLILGVQLADLTEPPVEPVLSLRVSLVKQAGGEPDRTVATAPPAELPAEPVPAPTPAPPVRAEPPPPKPPARVERKPQPIVAVPAPKAAVPKRAEAPARPVPAEPAPPADTPKPARPAPAKPPAAARAAVEPAVPAPPVKPAPREKPAPPAQLGGLELMERGLQMSRLETTPRQPPGESRERRLNAESMTDLEGFYLESWRRKVEQVGTLNFPQEARRLDRSSGPTLDVAIRADGTLHSVTLVRSSGSQALDEAARRIVQMAAPYAPFPEALRRRYDLLHIVRRWKFEQGRLLGR